MEPLVLLVKLVSTVNGGSVGFTGRRVPTEKMVPTVLQGTMEKMVRVVQKDPRAVMVQMEKTAKMVAMVLRGAQASKETRETAVLKEWLVAMALMEPLAFKALEV